MRAFTNRRLGVLLLVKWYALHSFIWQSLDAASVLKVEDLMIPLVRDVQYLARLLDALVARFCRIKTGVSRRVVLGCLRSHIPLLLPDNEHEHRCVVSVEPYAESLGA